MNCTSYFKCSDKSVLHMERLNTLTLLKSVDKWQVVPNIYQSTRNDEHNIVHGCCYGQMRGGL